MTRTFCDACGEPVGITPVTVKFREIETFELCSICAKGLRSICANGEWKREAASK